MLSIEQDDVCCSPALAFDPDQASTLEVAKTASPRIAAHAELRQQRVRKRDCVPACQCDPMVDCEEHRKSASRQLRCRRDVAHRDRALEESITSTRDLATHNVGVDLDLVETGMRYAITIRI
jgi:hypothetical protein